MNFAQILKPVLRLDAFTCAAMGALLLLAAGPIAALTAIPQPLLLGAGAILLPVAALMWWTSSRSDAWAVTLVIAGNVAWVAASLALLAGPWITPNLLGTAFIAVQAIAVAALATLEWLGIVRARAIA